MALVAGVGLGIFLIALALGLAIFGVLAAQKSKRSVPIQAAILGLLVLVCVLVTLATRKGGPDAGLETEVEVSAPDPHPLPAPAAGTRSRGTGPGRGGGGGLTGGGVDRAGLRLRGDRASGGLRADAAGDRGGGGGDVGDVRVHGERRAGAAPVGGWGGGLTRAPQKKHVT